MSFSVEVFSLALYVLQQLGVMLAVGAQTAILAAYLLSIRDGVVEIKEAQFAGAIRRILSVGMAIIILSGFGAIAFHILIGQEAVLYAPAFLFKWVLIGILGVLLLASSKVPFTHYLSLGFAGATWYALFVLHILAPVTSWTDLGVLYGVWVTGFMLVWIALVYMLRGGPKEVEVKEIKKVPPIPLTPKAVPRIPLPRAPAPVVPVAPPAPKPALVAAVAPHKPVPPPALHAATRPPLPVLPSGRPLPPTAPVPHKPKVEERVQDPDESPELPAIRVMPKTPEDMLKQNRPSVVQFNQT